MRIAFDISSAIGKNPTGVSTYIRNFLKSFVDSETGHSLSLLYEISRLKYKNTWFKIDSLPTRVYHKSLLPVFKKADIVHGLDSIVPNWKGPKKIVNFYDIFMLLNRDNFISPESFRNKKERDYRKLVSISDLIITTSENTKRDLVDFFQISESRVASVYPGLDSDFFQRKSEDETDIVRKEYGLKSDYLLFVGAVSGKKNTANLVEGYAISKARNEFDLVLAGSVSYMGERTLEAIEKHDLGEKVKILGYLPDEQIPALYSAAKGFVFPTFYEGFGFPILEAMLCEVPVLTSNVGSAPEVGGKFASYVDPHDVDSIAFGIDKLVGTSDHDLTAAREYAKRFNWKNTVEEVLKIYQSIIAE